VETSITLLPAPLAPAGDDCANVEPLRLAVVSGMSGAGKQLAARYFEDMGWRVIDNLPPRLLPLVAAPVDAKADTADADSDTVNTTPLCLISDVRGGAVSDLLPALQELRDAGRAPVLLFLDASDETLIQRFKETRRSHPLFAAEGGILPAIARERVLLAPVRERADLVIDTSGLPPADLRAHLLDAFGGEERKRRPLTVTVASFGFKHGTPLDADLLFDVRFLRNPYYDEVLRPLDGRDPVVEEYVMADDRTPMFLERLYDLVGWSLPHYVSEGKAYLTIAIGCTGGRHRSVVVAEKLGRFLEERGYRVLVQHRDVERKPVGG